MARRLIARAWLGASSRERQLGEFTLRPSQVETVTRIESAFASFGGALLADPPGTGKTIVALAVARRAERAIVVAPAALRAHWEEMSGRAAVRITFASHERLSRRWTPGPAPLVIVDEAHHARTPGTARYGALARLTAGARVLLLTATPVVNRSADRDALLALFLGAEPRSEETLGRCIIRRRGDDADHPALRRLPDLQGDADVAGLAAALERLPPPMAIAEGTAATALIRISLALAWQSSLAALDAALRRREQRGEAMRDLLAAGRNPSREALRFWAITDEDTQLVLAELVGTVAAADRGLGLDTLEAHLDAVRAIRRLIAPHIAGDSRTRAAGIRSLAAAHPHARIALLARHAATVRALQRELRGDPGVLSITGRTVKAAAGRWTREEVLAAIGPRAPRFDPRDPRAIRILVATDILSEGVEMQGVGIVVHADLPWTPARITQRRGRIVRPGGAAREVYEARFATPSGAERLLRLGARLARKRGAARRSFQAASSGEALDCVMREWASLGGGEPIAAAAGPFRGLVAAVRVHAGVVLIAGRERLARQGGWRLTTRAGGCACICRAASGPEFAAAPDEVRVALRLVRRLLTRRAAAAAVGASSTRTRGARERLLTQLDAILSSAAPAGRAALAVLQHDLLDRLGDRIEVGLERQIAALQRTHSDGAGFLRALGEVLDRFRSDVVSHGREVAKPRLIGLLLLTPVAPLAPTTLPDAPSSAAPGTAAPR